MSHTRNAASAPTGQKLVRHRRLEQIAVRRQHALDAAYHRNPERFVAGPPVAARPPQRVMLNPLDAAPPTVATLLETPDDQVATLWPAAAVSDIPIISLPGATMTPEHGLDAT
jgi:hypothetical protein